MIDLVTAYLDYSFDGDGFTKAIDTLSKTLYKPIVHTMHTSALKTLGVKQISVEDLKGIRHPFSKYGYNEKGGYEKIKIEGEIFKHSEFENSIFFMIYGLQNNVILNNNLKLCKLEIGIITSNSEEAAVLLRGFSETIKLSLEKNIKHKYKKQIDWLYLKDSVNFENFKWYKDSDKIFGQPEYNEGELEGALLMRDRNYRNQLREIGQAGFAREQDVLSNDKGVKHDKGNEVIIKNLAEHNLLKVQGLLQCRKRQTPIMRLEDSGMMENETVKSLKCGLCGAFYKDELIINGYSLSEMGKKLMNKSHWMTIILTDLLLKKGINKDSILWNITDANEEVDLIVGKKDQLWIFELKDRDFGAGDAHALNYRRSRFNANKPIVFATDKISIDAKRVFKDIEVEVSADVKGNVIPLYIEGFSELDSGLNSLISEAVIQKTFDKVKSLSEITGSNLIPSFEKLLSIDLSKFNVDDDNDNDLPF